MSSKFIYISGHSQEFSEIYASLAKRLPELGYQARWVDAVAVEDPLGEIQTAIEKSRGVIHLVGQRYGAEPKGERSIYGRCSYIQHEWHYAREIKKTVLVLISNEEVTENHDPEALSALQQKHRERFPRAVPCEMRDQYIVRLCSLVDKKELRTKLLYLAAFVVCAALIALGVVEHRKSEAAYEARPKVETPEVPLR